MSGPEVGNSGKTASGRPFKKGQSGNPRGRPRLPKDFKEAAQKLAPEALEVLANWMRSENPKASVAAASIIVDRAYGKPVQAIAGAEGGPLVVQILKYSEADLAE